MGAAVIPSVCCRWATDIVGHALAVAGFEACPICHGRDLAPKQYCLGCDRCGLDGVEFPGLKVDEARDRLRPVVRLRTRSADGPWRAALPASARHDGDEWTFELPASGPEPLLRALLDGGAGIETLAIERPGLHDAFVAIAGEAAARAMDEPQADAA